MLVRSTSARRQDAGGKARVPCQWRFLPLEEWTSDLNSELTSNFVRGCIAQLFKKRNKNDN
jgi:hypothetical protein